MAQGTLKDALKYAADNPTSDFAKALGKEISTGRFDSEAQTLGFDLSPIKQRFASTESSSTPSTGVFGKIGGDVAKDVSTGVAQSLLKTARGAGKLVQEGLQQTVGRGVEALTGVPRQNLGSSLYEGETPESLIAKTPSEKAGNVIGDIAQFALPGGQGRGVAGVASRALQSGATAAAQQGEIGSEAAIAAGTEAVLPGLGYAKNVASRLFKSLSSGLSGASTRMIDQIIANPSVSSSVAKEIETSGATKVLEENARKIVDGVSRLRKEASAAFRSSLDKLKDTEIDADIFRKNVSSVLDKYKVSSEGGERVLAGVEFNDPKNLEKASGLIDKLSTVGSDGLSIRKLADDIENTAYKTATSDEKISFNAFLRDLSRSLRDSISEASPILKEANKAYTDDLQLAGAVQDVLGKVKFKNLSEVNRVAKNLETLFSKKGLSEKTIDDFLTKIGVSPSDFKTSEATRQMVTGEFSRSSQGLDITEIIRSVTSSILTPETVRKAAVLTGYAEDRLGPILEAMQPAARGALIELLTNGFQARE